MNLLVLVSPKECLSLCYLPTTSTDWLTTWSKVLPGKLTGPQLVKTFPAFYETQKLNYTVSCVTKRRWNWDRQEDPKRRVITEKTEEFSSSAAETSTSAWPLSLSWATSIQSMRPSHFSNIHFNIILPFTPGSSKSSPSLRFPHRNPVCTFFLPHTCYMHWPSQSSWFDYTNNIWWRGQSIKLTVM